MKNSRQNNEISSELSIIIKICALTNGTRERNIEKRRLYVLAIAPIRNGRMAMKHKVERMLCASIDQGGYRRGRNRLIGF
jgi:hypothetical protein